MQFVTPPPPPTTHNTHTYQQEINKVSYLRDQFMDNAVRPVEQPFELCSLMHQLFMTMGTLSVQFQFDHDRLIYVPNQQSAIRVKYLPVTFENKCHVRSRSN